jgi:hypothetical protein
MVKYAEERGLIFRPENEKYGSDGFWRLTIGSKEENRMAVHYPGVLYCLGKWKSRKLAYGAYVRPFPGHFSTI